MGIFSSRVELLTGFSQASYEGNYPTWFVDSSRFLLDIIKQKKPSILSESCSIDSVVSGGSLNIKDKYLLYVVTADEGFQINQVDKESVTASDKSVSIYKATEDFPVFYIDNNTLYTIPDVDFSVGSIDLSIETTPDEIIHAVPERLWELVYILVAIQELDYISAKKHYDASVSIDDDDTEQTNLDATGMKLAIERKGILERDFVQKLEALTGIVFKFRWRKEYARD